MRPALPAFGHRFGNVAMTESAEQTAPIESHAPLEATVRAGGAILQRDSAPGSPTDPGAPPSAPPPGDPLTGTSGGGSTSFTIQPTTREISAANLTALWTNMTNSGTRESASVLPKFTPPPQYEYDDKDTVKKVAVTVVETKEMPKWKEADAQCPPIKNEWTRFFGVLDAHEDRHVAIDRKHFGNVHLKLVGKPKDVAWKTLDDEIDAANKENEDYDTSSNHGINEGANINTAVQCEPEKVKSTSEQTPPEKAAEFPEVEPAPEGALQKREGRAGMVAAPAKTGLGHDFSKIRVIPRRSGPETADPKPEGFSLKKFFTEPQLRLNLGSHNLYNEHVGKDFSWSTKSTNAAGEKVAKVTLGAATLPVPPPVGPILFIAEGSASVYAGGHARISVDLNNTVLELTGTDLAKVSALGTAALLSPLAALAMLQGMKFKGKGTLRATARASLAAGANLNLEVTAQGGWPVGAYLAAGLGIAGAIEAVAFFDMMDAPYELDFIGPIPRFRIKNLNLQAGAELDAKLGLSGYVAAGAFAGYGDTLSVRKELFRRSFLLAVHARLASAVQSEGAKMATLTTNSDGTPEINLQRIYIGTAALMNELSALIDGTPKNDNAAPAGDKAPTGTQGDPVLIYWCKPTSIYPDIIRVDDPNAYEKTPYKRTEVKALTKDGDKIGVPFWPEKDHAFVKASGDATTQRDRFRDLLTDHGFDWTGLQAEHVMDTKLIGNSGDRFSNLWPADASANMAAGKWHGHQGVWYREEGAEEPKNPTALSNVPDGKVLKIRAIVLGQPPEAPKPGGGGGSGGGP